MAKCPGCGVEVGSSKEWAYGPKGRKGPTFQVQAFKCANCGLKFRNYLQEGRVKFTLALKEGKFRKV
ncbi:MAG: hypothetical protein QXI36_02630 [Candidatus Bathyarchaeia archaeon]